MYDNNCQVISGGRREKGVLIQDFEGWRPEAAPHPDANLSVAFRSSFLLVAHHHTAAIDG